MNNGDMPAMPMFSSDAKPCQVRDTSTQSTIDASGLTKRETFAMAAMQGLLSNDSPSLILDTPINDFSFLAVKHADALLAELAKEKSCDTK